MISFRILLRFDFDWKKFVSTNRNLTKDSVTTNLCPIKNSPSFYFLMSLKTNGWLEMKLKFIFIKKPSLFRFRVRKICVEMILDLKRHWIWIEIGFVRNLHETVIESTWVTKFLLQSYTPTYVFVITGNCR
jgi:hypothetical protein